MVIQDLDPAEPDGVFKAGAGAARVAAGPGLHQGDDALDHAASAFIWARPLLFGIAYRMLGSVTDAEDVLQDTWMRWQHADHQAIANPSAFLAQITTRLAINISRSARSRREISSGPWLCDPVDTSTDPAMGAERGEELELALLLLIQRLTAAQRAAYILREAFDYPYDKIAQVLRISPVYARQILSRAHKRMAAPRLGPVDRSEHRRLVRAFRDAAQSGNITALEHLLASHAAGSSDDDHTKETARMPTEIGRAA